MILGNYRRIIKSDYSEQNQEDIDKLSITLNESLEALYSLSAHQVTFTENINCTLQTFTATVNASGIPISPIIVKIENWQKNINGIICLNTKDTTNKSNIPMSGIFIDFSINNNITSTSNSTNTGNNNSVFTININYIKGLVPNIPYLLTILII